MTDRLDKFSAAVSGIWGAPIPSEETMEKQLDTLQKLGASEETLRIAEQARQECARLRLVRGSRPRRTSPVEVLAQVRDRTDRDWVRAEQKRALKELAWQLAGLGCLWLIATWVLWW